VLDGFSVDALEDCPVECVGPVLVDVEVSVDVVIELVVADALCDVGSVDETVDVDRTLVDVAAAVLADV